MSHKVNFNTIAGKPGETYRQKGLAIHVHVHVHVLSKCKRVKQHEGQLF